MPATYDIGDSVKLTFTVRDENNALINATVAIVVTKPDSSTSSPTITNVSTGIYTAVVAVDQAGTWLYRWTATGAATTAEDGQFYVAANADARVYVTVAELKQQLNIPLTDTSSDEEIADAILAESREIDNHCQRHFWQATEIRTLIPTDLWCLELGAYNDLVSVTTLKTDTNGDGVFETTWTTGDYRLLCADDTPNINAGPEPRPYTKIRAVANLNFPLVYGWGQQRCDLIQINGVWGWPAVPTDVRRACRLLAVELFQLKETKFGATGIGDLGIIRVGQNRIAARLLDPYRQRIAAVA